MELPSIRRVSTKVTHEPRYRHKRGRPQKTTIHEYGFIRLLDGMELVLNLETTVKRSIDGEQQHPLDDKVTTLSGGIIRCAPRSGYNVYHFELDDWSIRKRLAQPWGHGVLPQDFRIHIGPILHGDVSHRWLNIENVEYFNKQRYIFGTNFNHAITFCRLNTDSSTILNHLVLYFPSVLCLLIVEYINNILITTMDQICGIITFPSDETKQCFLSSFRSTVSYLQHYAERNNIKIIDYHHGT